MGFFCLIHPIIRHNLLFWIFYGLTQPMYAHTLNNNNSNNYKYLKHNATLYFKSQKQQQHYCSSHRESFSYWKCDARVKKYVGLRFEFPYSIFLPTLFTSFNLEKTKNGVSIVRWRRWRRWRMGLPFVR